MNLIDSFNKYIEEDFSNYAIMLKGDWGSGKTYFIENKWVPLLDRQKYDIKMVSLMGFSSIEMLLEEIGKNLKKLESQKGKLKYKDLFINNGFQFLSSKFNISLNIKDFYKLNGENWLENKEENKIKVLIIDDLERCKIDIEELYGLLLHSICKINLRVIIICNESELLKENEKYKKIQEKLIGDVFCLDTDKKEIIFSFLKSINLKYVYSESIKKVFVNILENEKLNKQYFNLRIIKRCILKFKYLGEELDKIFDKSGFSQDIVTEYISNLFSIFLYLYYQKEIGILNDSDKVFNLIDEFYYLGDFISLENEMEEKELKGIESIIEYNKLNSREEYKFIPLRCEDFSFYKMYLFYNIKDIKKYETYILADLKYIKKKKEVESDNNKDCLYKLIQNYIDCDCNTFKQLQLDFYEELRTKTKCSINYLLIGYTYLIYFLELNILHIDTLKTIDDINILFQDIAKKVEFVNVEPYFYYSNNWSLFSLGYRGYTFDFESLRTENVKSLKKMLEYIKDFYFFDINKKRELNFLSIIENYDNSYNYYLEKLRGLSKFDSSEKDSMEIFWGINIFSVIGYSKLSKILYKNSLKGQYNFWYVVKENYIRNESISAFDEDLHVFQSFKVYYNEQLEKVKKEKSNSIIYLQVICEYIAQIIQMLSYRKESKV